MSFKLAELQQDLLALSDNEREQVLSVFSFTTKYEPTLEEKLTWEAIVAVCMTGLPLARFVESYGTKKYAAKVNELYHFVGNARKHLRPAQLNALVKISLDCLALNLRSRGIPVTPSTLLNSLSLLASAVDDQYPGYAEARLLHRIVPAA